MDNKRPFYIFMVLRNDNCDPNIPVYQLDEIRIGLRKEEYDYLNIKNICNNFDIVKELKLGTIFFIISQKHYEYYYSSRIGSKKPILFDDIKKENKLYNILSNLKKEMKYIKSYCLSWESACEWEGLLSLHLDDIKDIIELLQLVKIDSISKY